MIAVYGSFSNIFLFSLLQNDSPSTLRKVVFDELKKFSNKNAGFVGAQG